jgi:DNA-binding response OmpR family regulator
MTSSEKDPPYGPSWRMRILVVEDDARAASILADLLRAEGHDVEVALDGPSGVAAARSNPPDAVLLDISLPGFDGWQVAKRVQTQPTDKRPLLVAITSQGSPEDRLRSRQAGIDLHLTKPVDVNALRSLLGRFRSIIAG